MWTLEVEAVITIILYEGRYTGTRSLMCGHYATNGANTFVGRGGAGRGREAASDGDHVPPLLWQWTLMDRASSGAAFMGIAAERPLATLL